MTVKLVAWACNDRKEMCIMVIFRVMSLYHHNHQWHCQCLCEQEHCQLGLYHWLHLHLQDIHQASVQHCCYKTIRSSSHCDFFIQHSRLCFLIWHGVDSDSDRGRQEEDLVLVTLDNIIFIWSSLSTDPPLCEWKLHNRISFQSIDISVSVKEILLEL